MTGSRTGLSFRSDGDLRRFGDRFCAGAIPRVDWTHAAHLAAATYLIGMRDDLQAENAMPDLIRALNNVNGVKNTESEGYHHTITMAFLSGVREFLARTDPALRLADKVNALLAAPEGRRDWPLTLYSRDLLFSVPARMAYVAPDLAL